MSLQSSFKNPSRPPRTRRVSWDPAIHGARKEGLTAKQAPVSPASVYDHEVAQDGQAFPSYIYSWPQGSSGHAELSSSDEENADYFSHFDVPSTQASRPRRRLLSQPAYSRDSYATDQFSSTPKWRDDHDLALVPQLGPVPVTARKGVVHPPPRTKDGYTPHPMVQTSFRQQMEQRPVVGSSNLHSSPSNGPLTVYRPGMPSAALPQPSSALRSQMPHQPRAWMNQPIRGAGFFKMYDTVYVPVWSYIRNVYIWTKGTVLQSVVRLNRNGIEELSYKVVLRNPDNGEEQCLTASPELGQIVPVPLEDRPQSLPLLHRELLLSPSLAAAPLQASWHLEPGAYIFNKILYIREDKKRSKHVWFPGVCVMRYEPYGYWIRGLGGSMKGYEYISNGPFKSFSRRSLNELQDAGEVVDMNGCQMLK